MGVRKIDTEDETISFDVDVWDVEDKTKTSRENYVKSFEDFVTYVQSPTMFES